MPELLRDEAVQMIISAKLAEPRTGSDSHGLCS